MPPKPIRSSWRGSPIRSAYPITTRSAAAAAADQQIRADRTATSLVIDHHAMRRTADRHRTDNPAGTRIDDGDVIACAIGDEQARIVGAERHAPWPLAHQNVIAHLLGPGVDDV